MVTVLLLMLFFSLLFGTIKAAVVYRRKAVRRRDRLAMERFQHIADVYRNAT